MRVTTLCLFAVLLLLSAFETAHAADEVLKPLGYPSRPLEVIVPFAAGGGMDTSVRLLSRFAEPELGEKIEVANLTRGGNIEGNLQGINATPNGYTLGSWGMGLVTDELVVKNAPYTHSDVLALCMYADDPHIIAVGAEFARKNGIATLDDLAKHVRANPGKVVFGSGGNWTSHDFIRLKIEEGIGGKFVRMPFLGGALSLRATAEGNCDVVTPFPAEIKVLPDADRILPLAVTSERRIDSFPDVPTVVEAGYPGMTQSMWRVLTLPRQTNRQLARYLESVFEKAVNDPGYCAGAAELGITPRFMGMEELKEFLEKEYEGFAGMAEKYGIRVNRE